MCASEFFQQFRCLGAPQRGRAVSKDFGRVLLCNHRKVLVLFRRRVAPGFRNVFRSPAVAFTFTDRLPAPIKVWRHLAIRPLNKGNKRNKGTFPLSCVPFVAFVPFIYGIRVSPRAEEGVKSKHLTLAIGSAMRRQWRDLCA